MLQKSRFCRFLYACILLLPVAVIHAKPDDVPPNIIVILADNLNASLLGPYGNREIKTPHLDRLAAEGMTFHHAYAASGVCSPTRATLLTGLIPSQTGVHNGLPSNFAIDNWSAIGEFKNLPQTLADAGYQTAMVGKYHLGQPDRAQLGFDYWVTFPSGHTTGFYDETIIDNGNIYRQDNIHLTDFWTQKALEFIEKADQKTPFFLYLSYNGPYNLAPLVLQQPNNRHAGYYQAHTPSMPQEPIHDYLKEFLMQGVNNGGDLLQGWRIGEGKRENEKTAAHTSKLLDLAWATVRALNNRTAMINVASETAMIDDGIGAVLDALDAQGLAQNTLVIFTADQGAAYGQHGLWGNSSQAAPTVAFDQNMRIPFIVRHPQSVPSGASADVMVNQFDVFPTLLDYIGLQDTVVPASPGRSFARTLLGERQPGWSNEVYFEYILTRALRTPEWKYIQRFLTGPNELYDLQNDPGETQNLVENEQYRDVIETLAQKLSGFFATYADPEFDVWQGGTAKAVLMYGGKNEVFEQHFQDWKKPFVR